MDTEHAHACQSFMDQQRSQGLETWSLRTQTGISEPRDASQWRQQGDARGIEGHPTLWAARCWEPENSAQPMGLCRTRWSTARAWCTGTC